MCNAFNSPMRVPSGSPVTFSEADQCLLSKPKPMRQHVYALSGQSQVPEEVEASPCGRHEIWYLYHNMRHKASREELLKICKVICIKN